MREMIDFLDRQKASVEIYPTWGMCPDTLTDDAYSALQELIEQPDDDIVAEYLTRHSPTGIVTCEGMIKDIWETRDHRVIIRVSLLDKNQQKRSKMYLLSGMDFNIIQVAVLNLKRELISEEINTNKKSAGRAYIRLYCQSFNKTGVALCEPQAGNICLDIFTFDQRNALSQGAVVALVEEGEIKLYIHQLNRRYSELNELFDLKLTKILPQQAA